MIHANSEERASLNAGLRDLADFLEKNQDVPVPLSTDVMVFSSASADDEMKEETDGIAALIGAEITDDTADAGHYTASRHFGSVEFRAVAIPASARAYYDVRAFYAENIRLDFGEEV